MNKTIMYLFISIGGMIGAYIPVLLGAGALSLWSILGSVIGGFVGIGLAVKLSN